MRFGNLIFGVALLLVASTLALTITFRNAAPEQMVANAERPSPDLQAPRSPESATVGRSDKPHHSAGRQPHQRLPDVEELDLVLALGPKAPKLTPIQRQEITQRTVGVKRAALVKLDKMTEQLDLTTTQRHKIYPNLLKSTNGYHEAMVINYPVGFLLPEVASNETQSPDEAIHDALDPDQQDEFVEDQLDRLAWWNEIVAQLEEDFDSTVAAGTAAPAPEEDAPAPDAPAQDSPQQGGNIFDLLNK
ncbi:MAG: hypothetical protein ABGZ49_13640 [Akkermansiaceae bacterium]|jgi:hypothetical protein|tara:strand:- start:247 stop:987 length:741 start_codon:yes stop_codon:yes gene_type:complete